MSFMSTAGKFDPIAQLAALRAGLARFPRPILELMARIGIAALFMRSGLLKLESWQSTLDLFAGEDYSKVPLLPSQWAAYAATGLELGAAALIALGLFARLGAAALLGMTLVIQVFVFPESWPDHLLWASVLAYLVTRGPGKLSVDWLIARRLFGAAG